jgi:hypothetical protein
MDPDICQEVRRWLRNGRPATHHLTADFDKNLPFIHLRYKIVADRICFNALYLRTWGRILLAKGSKNPNSSFL